MVTPFLLSYIHKKTKGKSLDVNISLALNNVQLGAKIAKKFKCERRVSAVLTYKVLCKDFYPNIMPNRSNKAYGLRDHIITFWP